MNHETIVWQKGVLLHTYSTYRIGGEAKLFTVASTVAEMKRAISHCLDQGIPYYILGRGSNTLFDDRGYNGAVILNHIRFFERKGRLFHAGSGVSFSLLGNRVSGMGFSGLEYATGIPGSLGGAIYMNAGAAGREISSVTRDVDYLTEEGDVVRLLPEEIGFRYRGAEFFHRRKGVILAATLELSEDPEARKRVDLFRRQREATQPWKEPSCGCVFKNPSLLPAGALIEKMGFKGCISGGVGVSEKHANFIVNKGGGTARAVKAMIERIEKEAFEQYGIRLEREVRFVPYEAGEKR